jgi:hypothetical protein
MNKTDPFNIAIVAAVIAGVFTMLGVALGFGLEHYSRYLSERKKIKQEFLEIRGTILSTPLNNFLYPSLYPHLRSLKAFFVKHPEYLKRQQNDSFFRKWLTDPFLDTGLETTRWPNERVEEMFRDLSETKV